MNSVFRTYPEHPWIHQWLIEARACSAAFHEDHAERFFVTTEIVAQLAPNVENPAWMLQIPAPQNSRTRMLCNGFCAFLEKRKTVYSAEVLMPEPGILWGRFKNIPAPVLLSPDAESISGEGYQWIEDEEVPVLLAVRGDTFCVITRERIYAEAVREAEALLEKSFDEAIEAEAAYRAGAQRLFAEMTHHDALSVLCIESMIRSLRPHEGSIPGLWSESADTAEHTFNINELHATALAWSLIDPATAEQLLFCGLRLQTSSGAIPIRVHPRGTFSTLEAPTPLLAKTVESVWQVSRNADFIEQTVPLLRRHLQWLLHHFDPKRRGFHTWKNRNEMLEPEQFESDLSTVDLTILLLTEIEALNRLERLYRPDQPTSFTEERDTLEQNIPQFWNNDRNAYSNAILHGRVVPFHGLPEFMPLLWPRLPGSQRNALIDRLSETGALPDGKSTLSWRKSDLDSDAFPVNRQMLLLGMLQTAAPQGTQLTDFSRITLQGFIEWHTLRLQQNLPVHVPAATAACIMNIQAVRRYRYHAKGPVTGRIFRIMRRAKADRFDLFVILITIGILFGVHLYYDVLKTPPPQEELKAQMNAAYASQNLKDALSYSLQILKHYPEDPGRAGLLSGNILLNSGEYSEAERIYRTFRNHYPDSPAGMIGLGLALQLQEKFKEADEQYAEFCYLFDMIFPDLVRRIESYRDLMGEGFSAPPKWNSLFNLRIMHKIE